MGGGKRSNAQIKHQAKLTQTSKEKEILTTKEKKAAITTTKKSIKSTLKVKQGI